jgi:DNA-binding IclR family transcriptional regulator
LNSVNGGLSLGGASTATVKGWIEAGVEQVMNEQGRKSAKTKIEDRAAGMPRHGNRSIVVGVTLLKAIAGFGQPAALVDIAKAVGMTPTRTQRYLLGLMKAGLVEQNKLSQRYDLGFQVIELGVLALGRVDAVRLANESLLELSKECNAPALVIVWGTNGPTVVRCEQAESPSVIRVREGRNLSLLNSSSGRVFLAFLDDDAVQPILKKELAAAGRAKHANAKPDIAALRADVRSAGVGVSIGEEDDHLVSISAPVFNVNGSPALCITILNIRGWLDTSPDGKAAKLLRATAARLSRRLGAGTGQ